MLIKLTFTPLFTISVLCCRSKLECYVQYTEWFYYFDSAFIGLNYRKSSEHDNNITVSFSSIYYFLNFDRKGLFIIIDLKTGTF